jgi:hypothetical protein
VFLYGTLITSTGWTRREVDNLTMDEANELMAYWREFPPAHLILGARYLKPQQKARGNAKQQIEQLAMISGANLEKMPDKLADDIKWAEEMMKAKPKSKLD